MRFDICIYTDETVTTNMIMNISITPPQKYAFCNFLPFRMLTINDNAISRITKKKLWVF